MAKKIRKIVKKVGNKLLDAAGRVVLGPGDPDYDKELKKLKEKNEDK